MSEPAPMPLPPPEPPPLQLSPGDRLAALVEPIERLVRLADHGGKFTRRQIVAIDQLDRLCAAIATGLAQVPAGSRAFLTRQLVDVLLAKIGALGPQLVPPLTTMDPASMPGEHLVIGQLYFAANFQAGWDLSKGGKI